MGNIEVKLREMFGPRFQIVDDIKLFGVRKAVSLLIRDTLFDIKRPFTRLAIMYRWLPVIWNDCDWDYVFILVALKHKLIRTRSYLENSKVLVKQIRSRQGKQLHVAICLIDRVIGEDVNSVDKWEGEFHPYNSDRWATHANYLEKQDWEYLFKIMKKYMRDWWD